MSDDTSYQRTLDGERVDDDDDADLNDFGESRAWYESKGGFNRFTVSSLLQKAVRRGAEEEAAWAAWELARSGWGANLWDRLTLYVIEDLAAGVDAALLIDRYERLAKERWSMDSWEGRLCAIHAALTAACARSSREGTYADEAFRKIAQERADAKREEREPQYDFPIGDELTLGGRYDVVPDKHTRPGAQAGRDLDHFQVHGARVGPEGETDVGRTWRRQSMQLDGYTEAQIDHALQPVADDTTRWDEPDDVGTESLDTYDA